MVKKLKQYFPPVWERNVILSEIGRKKGAGGREHSEPGNAAEIHVYPS